MPQNIRAVVFDAYGTLFDVFSVSQLAEAIFPHMGQNLAQIWRDKQIEYTRLRTFATSTGISGASPKTRWITPAPTWISSLLNKTVTG